MTHTRRTFPLILACMSALASCATPAEKAASNPSVGKAASDPSASADISKFTLSVGPCFGSCPVYKFEVNAEGELHDRETADRKDAIPVIRRGKITPAAFRRLAAKYQAIDFSPPKVRRFGFVPDHSSTYITVDRYGRQIVHRMSGNPPAGLRMIEKELLRLRKEASWEEVNAEAAPAPAGRR